MMRFAIAALALSFIIQQAHADNVCRNAKYGSDQWWQCKDQNRP